MRHSQPPRRPAAGLAFAPALGLCLLMPWSIATIAQPAVQQQNQRRPIPFNIPAQPLVSALAEFGRQSGFQISYKPALLRGLNSLALTGNHTPDAALQQLLAPSALSFRWIAGDSITVEPAPRTEGTTLKPVHVTGNLEDQDARQSPSGYVALRSAAGSKTDTPLREIPQSISVLTRDQLDARNVQREGEAFRYSAGVFAEPYGGDPRPAFDAPFIRGFEVVDTGVYRDGLRELRGVWSGFTTEFYGLERVDILRGPSSVLYGQGSPGGVVDKISKRPAPGAVREIKVDVGSYDRRQLSLDVGGPVTQDETVLTRLVGVYRDSDTQYDYDGSHSIPDDRQYLAPSLSVQISEATTLSLYADFFRNRTAGPFTVTVNARPSHILTGEPHFNESDLRQYTTGYRVEHAFNDTWSIRQNLRYGKLDLLYSNMTNAGIQANGRTMNRNATSTDEQLDALLVDNQLEGHLSAGRFEHTVLVGIDYQEAEYDSLTRGGTGPTLDLLNPVYGQTVAKPVLVTSSSHQERDQLGFYVQDQIKFDDHWVLTLGGRQDSAEADTTNRRTNTTAKQDDDQFTYRIGLSYLFDNGVTPYTSYTESFLPTAGNDFAGNAFEPTTGEQYEVGVKYQPSPLLSMSVALFDLTQQNVLTQDPERPATAFRVQTGEINSQGIELESVLSLTQGFNLIASLTYNDVEVTKDNPNAAGVSKKGNRPTWIAERMAALWADYTVQGGVMRGFGGGIGVRYVGPTYADAANTIENDAYTLTDLSLHYDLGAVAPSMAGTNLQLNVNNLFDKEYYQCTATNNCTWGLERSVVGSVRYRW